MIDNFMKGITKEDVNKFAKSKNVFLDDDELTFTYDFVKKNWKWRNNNENWNKVFQFFFQFQANDMCQKILYKPK